MTVDTIRFIDRKLVKIFRDILRMLSGKSRPLPPSPKTGDRILIMKYWGLGNIIQASPTLKKIRQSCPDCQITFLTLSQNSGLYDNNGLYDRSLSLPMKSMIPFAWEVLKLIGKLRKQRFDWVIDLDPLTFFSESMAFLSGAPCRAGFVRAEDQRSLYTHPVLFREDIHICDVFQTVAHTLDAHNGDGQLIPIVLNQEEESFLDSFCRDHHIAQDDFLVGINVNASEVAKERRWPRERFAELADRITNTNISRVILLGSPSEREYVQKVASQMTTKPIMAAGKTTLRQMIALLGRCNLFISNDSGPVHMAVAQGSPTVAIFGPETPERYGPRGSKHQVIYKGLPCSPCISFFNAKKVHCDNPTPPCIYQITTDEIWEVVQPLLPTTSPKENINSLLS
ncbi:hypothetical protein AMJ86_01650 [bacterium SM23_57]|nr:MAG: hypothetical protein AMJ86_01650 [bacterium SM23_57]